LEPAALALLEGYLDLVVQWNARTDLTAARNTDELVDLFVADAAMLALCSEQTQTWIDIGTGAGAPGLPLKLLRPAWAISLLEPKTKRVAFLRTAVSSLGFPEVEVRRTRSDEVEAGSYDVGLSRATFAPELWLVEGARIARQSVWVLLAQGEPPVLPGWHAQLDASYVWPLTKVSRRALRFAPDQ
jgi:16S rRNA (guanine527-N7)-methyltransferase